MKSIAYVDGFNLYFRAIQGTPFKWLNVATLVERKFHEDDVVQVRYFTAPIKPVPDDPFKRDRQQVYLRALESVEKVCVELGRYQVMRDTKHVVAPKPGCDNPVLVWIKKEKQSDVNMASRMLLDAFDRRMEKAIVVTNDSDLLTPMRVLRERFGIIVAVYTPDRHQPQVELQEVADTFTEIRPKHLEDSQFAETLTDKKGSTITKPMAWRGDPDWRATLQAIKRELPRGG